jgi:HlyD family type I secretion membrane fusion protein
MRAGLNLTLSEPVGAVLDFSQAMNRSRHRLIAMGGVVLAMGFGGLGTWAAFAPLKSAAVAQGVVKVASERKTIQHLEGGIVKEILVKEGQEVAAGAVLVRLDDINARARFAVLRGGHDALTAEFARLEAERYGRPVVTFPQEMQLRRDEPRVASLIEGEVSRFVSRRAAAQGQIDVLLKRKQQSDERITGLMTQVDATRTKLDYVSEEIKGAETLMEIGLYTKTKFFALKRAEADLSGDTGRLRADIAEARALNGETDLRIMDLRNQIQKEASDRLQDVRAKLGSLTEQLDAAADTLARTEIVARQAGTVMGLEVHTLGGVVKPGSAILDIVPKDDKMIVEARVRPEEIDQVHKGLLAEVRFTAFSSRSTPVFPGKVSRVSADRFTDPARGLAYYLAQIEIDPKQVSKLTLQPGMPAEVHIVTGERTALDYITKPIWDQVQRGMLEK